MDVITSAVTVLFHKVRGRKESSRNPEDIVKEVEELVSNGVVGEML